MPGQAGHQPAIAFTGKKAKEILDERLSDRVIPDWTPAWQFIDYLVDAFKDEPWRDEAS
jgi:hypothetical protein